MAATDAGVGFGGHLGSMTTEIADFFGYAAGIFLMISFLPQIIKSARRRSMADFSWAFLWATAASALFYELYALSLSLTPVLVMNGIFLLSVIVAMLMKWQFERPVRPAMTRGVGDC